MPSRMAFNLSLSRQDSQRATKQGPMRLLVMADFSGLPAAQRSALAQRTIHRVDLDNLDDVLRRLAPHASLGVGLIGFESMEDFHPDRLYARLDALSVLRDIRRRLRDPAQFAQAAAELLQHSASATGAAVAVSKVGAAPPPAEDLLAQLLGGKPKGAPAPAPVAATGIDAFIRSVVAPHSVPDLAPQQAPYLASVEAAIGEQLREVLQAPAFQALESTWRGVQWLINSLELDDDLQLHLLDVSRDELLADVVAAQGRIEQTGIYGAVVDRWRKQPEVPSGSALVGLYEFGPSDADIGLLAALGVLASQAGGPLLAAGQLVLAADDVVALAGWQALRRSEVAPWIGLAAPRVLLRLPYGRGSDPIDSVAFEEFGPTPVHQHFLWGNGALACALLIGRAFSQRGWDFEPGDEREIGDLPAFTFLQDGERELQACAEHYLGEEAAALLLAAGLMPLMSHRHRNAVTVLRMQSVALPVQRLAGLSGG
jgi:type VI secretion system protein ImpC